MLHPVFFTPRTTRTAEIHDDHEIKGRNITYTYVLNAYLEVPPWKGYAILGQPRMQVRSPRVSLCLRRGLIPSGVVLLPQESARAVRRFLRRRPRSRRTGRAHFREGAR